MPQLDLQYRPSTFSEVIGNQGVIKLLKIRSRSGNLGDQSMMLSGQRGCGKTTLARIIAKALSCTFLQDGEPCNECPSCISIMQDTSQSFAELDAASQGTIDRIREMINDSNYANMDGAKQVYIIDEAQRLSAAAQEAFLKAIESRLFIVILCTTDPQKVKIPIRSRLEEYPIHPPTEKELKERLEMICNKEKISYDDAGLKLLIKVKENCPRECIIALDTLSQLGKIDSESVKAFYRFESYEMVSKLLDTIDVNPKEALDILDGLQGKETPTWIKDSIIMAISSAVRVGVGGKATYPVPTAFFERRGKVWIQTAMELGRIEKANIHDIVSVLLKDSPVIPVIHTQPVYIAPPVETKEPAKTVVVEAPKAEAPKPAAEPAKKTTPKEPTTQKAPEKSKKPVKVDGVQYSSEERLTSFDDKVSQKKPQEETPKTLLQVGLDADHAPVSEKEFKESFLSRVRPR